MLVICSYIAEAIGSKKEEPVMKQIQVIIITRLEESDKAFGSVVMHYNDNVRRLRPVLPKGTIGRAVVILKFRNVGMAR